MIDLLKSFNDDYLQQNNNYDDNDLSIAENEQDLSKEIMEKKQKGLLRTGFTTGTSCICSNKICIIGTFN